MKQICQVAPGAVSRKTKVHRSSNKTELYIEKGLIRVNLGQYWGFAWFYEMEDAIVGVSVGFELINKALVPRYFPVYCKIRTIFG